MRWKNCCHITFVAAGKRCRANMCNCPLKLMAAGGRRILSLHPSTAAPLAPPAPSAYGFLLPPTMASGGEWR